MYELLYEYQKETSIKEKKVLLNDFEHMTRITVSRKKYINKRKKTFKRLNALRFKRSVVKGVTCKL